MPPTPEVSIAVLDRFCEEIDLYAAAVVIPGRAFVHDAEAKEILSADGVDRDVLRGPDMLTADAETSMEMTRNEVLDKEMVGIAALINTINRYGR